MSVPLFRKLSSLVLIALCLFIAAPAFAHDMTLGGSKWCFGENRILFTIELGSTLFQEMRGIREGGYDFDTLAEERFPELATGIVQPYIDDKLSIAVNGEARPVKVKKLVREANMWTIWLSVDDIGFNRPENIVKIDYRLFFEETNNEHVNVAFLYFSDADAGIDAVRKVFDYTHPDLNNGFEFDKTSWEIPVGGSAGGSAETPFRQNIFRFLSLGMKHILIGYDHIAFLVVLIVVGLSFREVLKIITSFTVAHSITLLLAALQIVSLDSRFVEAVIALSICYVALENMLAKEVNYRWLVTFAFGLIHGFGFAGVLQDFIVGKSNLVLSVVSFNVGVEIGQLMIFFIMLPVLHLLRNKFEPRRVTAGASTAIFVLGLTWLVERLFNLQLLSF